MHSIYYIFTYILDIYELLMIKLANMNITLENSISMGLGKILINWCPIYYLIIN